MMNRTAMITTPMKLNAAYCWTRPVNDFLSTASEAVDARAYFVVDTVDHVLVDGLDRLRDAEGTTAPTRSRPRR